MSTWRTSLLIGLTACSAHAGVSVVQFHQQNMNSSVMTNEYTASVQTGDVVVVTAATALNPDFRTTGLSGTCVLKMVQTDAWKVAKLLTTIDQNKRQK